MQIKSLIHWCRVHIVRSAIFGKNHFLVRHMNSHSQLQKLLDRYPVRVGLQQITDRMFEEDLTVTDVACQHCIGSVACLLPDLP